MKKDYEKIVKELEKSLNNTPGVITVGLGNDKNGIVLVVFVEEKKLDKKKLPPRKFQNLFVVMRQSGEAILHGV